MKIFSSCRNGLLLSSAVMALAACSGGGGGSANNGSAGEVSVNADDSDGNGTAVTADFVPTGFTCPTAAPVGTVNSGSNIIEACIISGDIEGDLTLPGTFNGSRIGYVLRGSVFVGDNLIATPAGSSAVLTVEPGAILMGESGEDVLVINPGSRLEAAGTVTEPIVFTSASDAADGSVDDGLVGGSRTAKGEWGGLVINGFARINDCNTGTATPGSAECTKTGEGGSGLFGGDDDTDDSGTLRYVRVQYAGFRFNGEDELNGIAFQGVGSGTAVDFIQVHNGNDDGVEFFGGAVNAANIVITGADDDSIDWTDGWRGDLQFALVVQDDVSADRGIEGDNRGNDPNVGTAEGVVSAPTVANFTFIGSSAAAASPGDGVKLRAGTGGILANGIVTGFGLGDGIDYDDTTDADDNASTPDVASTATPEIFSIFVAENDAPFDSDGGVIFNVAGSNNTSGAFSTLNGIEAGAAETAVTPTDVSAADNTIDGTADYIGAFDPATETNASNWTTGWTVDGSIPGAPATACPAGTSLSGDPVPTGRFERNICILPNEILDNTTLVNGNLYRFSGSLFIGTDAGPDASSPASGSTSAVLAIEPGVTVYGTSGEDAVIVNRGSQLMAAGAVDAPIVFTSQTDVLGTVAATDKGEWGGIVINGRAPINDCDTGTNTPGTIGCVKTGEGGSGLFGGNDENDNSGRLSFVQVRYAGFRFTGDDELNGIAFQGVGDGTRVDHIHVHNGNDDGVEFFGGTVDARYVIITGADDDSIDWTDGWQGSVQFALVIQDDISADRGIEGDNRGNDPNVGDAQNLRSFPTISNFTFFGSGDAAASPSDGVKLRAGTDGILLNGIIVGFRLGDGIDYDNTTDADENPATPDIVSTATPALFSIYVADNGTATDSDGAAIFTTANGNVDGGTARNLDGFIPNATLQSLITATDVSTLTFPDFADNSGDVDVTDYVGAFDPLNETDSDNWTTGWSFNVSTSLDNVR